MLLDRIKQVFAESNKSQSDLARMIGVTPQYISKLIKGNQNQEPSERIVLSILKAFPDIDEDWLRKGEGEMYLPEDEVGARMMAELLEDNSELAQSMKRLYLTYMNMDQEQKDVINKLLEAAMNRE